MCTNHTHYTHMSASACKEREREREADTPFTLSFYSLGALKLYKRLTHILDVCEVKNYPFNVELVDGVSLESARWADTQLTNKQMF